MRKIVALSVALAFALAGSPLASGAPLAAMQHGTLAAARHSPHCWRARRFGGRAFHTLRVYANLDLSVTQRKQMRGLARATFRQLHTQRLALQQKRAAFARATPGSAQYQAAVNDWAHAAAALTLASVQDRAAQRTRIYALLTPAQRTQLATLIAARQERVEWKRDHRPTRAS